MCGICGIFHADPERPVDAGVLERMSRTLRHRGPDGEGYHTGPGIGLATQRLKIIDPETGDQPIHNEDRTVWVVLNGEIYNYVELRRELQARGHRFYTQCDTEVIVHLYEEHGPACVERLRGMFGIALWDLKARELFLFRDRVGIKPLYYAELDGETVLFASEIKALLAHDRLPRAVDPLALVDFFSYRSIPPPRSILQGVRKLDAGEWARFSDRASSREHYWRLDFSPDRELDGLSTAEIGERCLHGLRESVKIHLRSDVPLGVLLSGGLDSSALVALIHEAGYGPIKTFTLGFHDTSFDESTYAEQVARHLGSEHYELFFREEEINELIPTLFAFMDEPLGDASIVPTYLVTKFASREVKVLLGGDGGDELLVGYPSFLAHQVANVYLRVPRLLRRGFVEPLVRRLPVNFDNYSFDFKAKAFVAGMDYSARVRHFYWTNGFLPDMLPELFDREFLEGMGSYRVYDAANPHTDRLVDAGMMEGFLYEDFRHILEDAILVKVDRASMANSVEVRVPYLDHEVVEFLTSVPMRFKLRNTRSKYFFKQALEGLLPREIIHRKKRGFSLPVARLINWQMNGLVRRYLSEESVNRVGGFRYPFIRTLLDDHIQGRKDNNKLLWSLFAFFVWYDRWMG